MVARNDGSATIENWDTNRPKVFLDRINLELSIDGWSLFHNKCFTEKCNYDK